MSTNPDSRDAIQSVLRAMTALEAIAERQPVAASELARAVKLPKTTIARLLKTLHFAGWIDADSRRGDPLWSLTTRARSVGLAAPGDVDLRDIARPFAEEVGHITQENIHLTKREGSSMIRILRIASTRSVQTVVETQVPIHQSGSGLAYLSRLSWEQVLELLPTELTSLTGQSIVDTEVLRQELDEVRARGYSINVGMYREDVASFGAAIVDAVGQPVGAFTISMPTYRLDDSQIPQFGELIREAADRASAELARVDGGTAA